MESDMIEVGALKVSCKLCKSEILIPISAGIKEKDGAHVVSTDADVADLWAHSLLHRKSTDEH